MPNIYLSPSTQEGNLYVNGGTEEYYMNLLADDMEPYLNSSGITFTRNDRNQSTAAAIAESNQGNYDLHLALHSNAAPEWQYGSRRGTEVFYSPRSTRGRAAATIIAENLKAIYPLPDLVRTIPTMSLGEVVKTKAPAVLIEFAYHDNEDDATWLKENLAEIARNVVLSLTEYFDIPFVEPMTPQVGIVGVRSGALNIRSKPNYAAKVLAKAYNGEYLLILGEWQGWYVVDYNGIIGYADSRYIY